MKRIPSGLQLFCKMFYHLSNTNIIGKTYSIHTKQPVCMYPVVYKFTGTSIRSFFSQIVYTQDSQKCTFDSITVIMKTQTECCH